MRQTFCLLVLACVAAGVVHANNLTKPHQNCPHEKDCCDRRNVNFNMVPRWRLLMSTSMINRSWKDCCKLCKMTPGCGHWSWRQINKKKGICYIYGIKYQPRKKWISGYCPPEDMTTTTEKTKTTTRRFNPSVETKPQPTLGTAAPPKI